MTLSHADYMQLAYEQACLAFEEDEVPVGAIIVKNGEILASAHNRKELMHDPTSHAELLAIQQACQKIGDWRLNGATLYTTLEPCPMCAGAILHARLDRLVYGAPDLKWGAAGTIVNLFDQPYFNHSCEVLVQDHSDISDVMTKFFQRLRIKN